MTFAGFLTGLQLQARGEILKNMAGQQLTPVTGHTFAYPPVFMSVSFCLPVCLRKSVCISFNTPKHVLCSTILNIITVKTLSQRLQRMTPILQNKTLGILVWSCRLNRRKVMPRDCSETKTAHCYSLYLCHCPAPLGDQEQVLSLLILMGEANIITNFVP